MNRLRITLKDGRRFVYPAAMAAVLVLLAGTANAQVLTVRCVPSHTISSSCYVPPTEYTTISAAVGAAVSGDIILVGPGRYNEYVTISTDSLSLFGAQAGKDARVDRHDPSKESIVNATGTGYTTITISAPYVVVDGSPSRVGREGLLTPRASSCQEARGRKSSTTLSKPTARGFS